MKTQLLVAAGLSVLALAGAGAQGCSPTTTPETATANAKQQAADLFQYMAPQLSAALAGGSATLGQTSTVGGIGHFSVGVHGTVLSGSLPKVNEFPQRCNGAQSTTLPTGSQVLGLPAADAAIGIFSGVPLALTNVGGVDLLLSASYLPEYSGNNVSVRLPDGKTAFGYGVRVGILSESIVMPGVSLSFLQRELPRVSLQGVTNNGDSLIVSGLKLRTASWRLAANKSLLMFGLSAGVGRDTYDSKVDTVRANVSGFAPTQRYSTSLNPPPSQKMTRTNVFIGASLNILLAKLSLEVGQASGGEVTTFNTFSGSAANASRTYGSLGVRFGL